MKPPASPARLSTPSRPAPRARRSPVMAVIGVVLVICGALVSVGLYTYLGDSEEVLVIAAPVARGEQIERTDLVIAQVGHDPLLAPVPAADLNDIVGKYAVSDLVPGTFLSEQAVGERVSPPLGFAEIGVSLAAGEYPDDELRPGDEVLVIAVTDGPPSTEQSSQESSKDTEAVPGTIVTITPPGSGGALTASILVAAQTAPRLAALSAQGQVALVLSARER